MRAAVFIVLTTLFTGSATALDQSVPAAIYTDPPTDAAHPARMTVLHIPSDGVLINSVVYSPPGAGAHPTLIICHGLPGNEKNLDIAHTVRRAGWNAVTFNYRGAWGTPGSFRFAQNLEDAAAVVAWLRTPKVAAQLGIDTKRIVIAGHSMGGWVAAHTAARDPRLSGAILISAADMGGRDGMPREQLVQHMAENMEALAGVTPGSMADELRTHSRDFALTNAVAGLARTPLLVLTSDDDFAASIQTWTKAVEAKGNRRITAAHVHTDHGWSDRRIALETHILNWLTALR